jgi:hypothetical protein
LKVQAAHKDQRVPSSSRSQRVESMQPATAPRVLTP